MHHCRLWYKHLHNLHGLAVHTKLQLHHQLLEHACRVVQAAPTSGIHWSATDPKINGGSKKVKDITRRGSHRALFDISGVYRVVLNWRLLLFPISWHQCLNQLRWVQSGPTEEALYSGLMLEGWGIAINDKDRKHPHLKFAFFCQYWLQILFDYFSIMFVSWYQIVYPSTRGVWWTFSKNS